MEPTFNVYGVSKDQGLYDAKIETETHSRREALDELKTQYQTLVKQTKKGKISSELTVDVARKNFEVTREIKSDKLQDLAGKTSFFGRLGAKITLYLAKHDIFIGELRTIKTMHDKFDSVIGLARKDVLEELKDSDLYFEISTKKGQTKIVEELKSLAKQAPNISIVALMPRRDVRQYLAYVNVKSNMFGNIEASEGVVRYLGRDEENEPKFLVRNMLQDEEIVTGIESLKNFIAYGGTPLESELALTKKEAELLPLSIALAKNKKE